MIPSTKIHNLSPGCASKLEALSFLSRQAQQLLLDNGKLRHLNKNLALFKQGDPVEHFYIIVSGAIKMIKNMATAGPSDITIIDILGPGDLLGATLLVQSGTNSFPATAKTMGKTEVLCFERSFFLSTWKTKTELMEYAHRQILVRMQRIQADRCIQRYSLEQKLAYFLTEKVAPIKGLKITRKDMADCIGASTEAIIRQLAKWSTEDFVSTVQHEITIKDHERLKKIWMQQI